MTRPSDDRREAASFRSRAAVDGGDLMTTIESSSDGCDDDDEDEDDSDDDSKYDGRVDLLLVGAGSGIDPSGSACC